MFHHIIPVFNRRNSFIIVFKESLISLSDIVFIALIIFMIYIIILGKQKKNEDNKYFTPILYKENLIVRINQYQA